MQIATVPPTLQVLHTLKLHCLTKFYHSMRDERSLNLVFGIPLDMAVLKHPRMRDIVMIHSDPSFLEVLTHL